MSQDALVKLKSTESDHVYYTRRNKKSDGAKNTERMEFKKFDPTLRKRVTYKQAKK